MGTKSEQLQIRVSATQKRALKRLAKQANQDVSSYVLSRALPVETPFVEILRELRDTQARRFALARLNDLLAGLASFEFAATVAVAEADLRSVDAFTANYVAAMVEHAAAAKGVAPPPWTAAIPPPEIPYFATPLKSLRLHLLRASPVAFRRRNLFVDSTVGDRV